MAASLESIPKDLRNLRACLLCSMIKTFEQFEFDGCDNCDEYLHMKNNRDMVYDCTSSNFDGMIALMNPEDSWVAKWQRIREAEPASLAVLSDRKDAAVDLVIRHRTAYAHGHYAIPNNGSSLSLFSRPAAGNTGCAPEN
ncbi:hypothetical protein HPB51_017466 [Rhipicephalus microplus]|uniref:Transcription elongation factor SPT4 n=1 Tax=Rhipicephalus microplus TaxID=6941 RepID=A0A9J6F7Q5_RHIMP|nr:hypothetical protein HPB51_017466 [Rhipicephalus microplus]